MPSDSLSDEYVATLRRLFARTPALALVKQGLESLEPGRALISLEPDERYFNGGGVIHGGVLATLLDSVGWFACATRSEGHWLFTAEFKVNYLEFVSRERVLATGEVLKKGGELFHVRMDARADGGRHVATALATYTLMPRKFQA